LTYKSSEPRTGRTEFPRFRFVSVSTSTHV
jgi:hypothetical protein